MFVAFLASLAFAAGPIDRAAADTTPRGPVVLILVENLDWAHAPSALDSFARASLSLHSAGSEFVDADGYLTVGQGTARRRRPVAPATRVRGDRDRRRRRPGLA